MDFGFRKNPIVSVKLPGDIYIYICGGCQSWKQIYMTGMICVTNKWRWCRHNILKIQKNPTHFCLNSVLIPLFAAAHGWQLLRSPRPPYLNWAAATGGASSDVEIRWLETPKFQRFTIGYNMFTKCNELDNMSPKIDLGRTLYWCFFPGVIATKHDSQRFAATSRFQMFRFRTYYI